MKVLVVHNRYQEGGGEDAVVDSEMRMLGAAGHRVVPFLQSNKQIGDYSSSEKLKLISSELYWSQRSRDTIKKILSDERPDVAHFHNSFLLITPSAYHACFESGIPVVQTLHNYRFFCPVGTFYRNGRVCEDCLKHGIKSAVIHKCWRNSYTLSYFIAKAVKSYGAHETLRQISHFIVPSEFTRQKFIANGFDPEKISVKPNFLSEDPGVLAEKENFALFAGTLRNYKGILTLIEAWKRIGLDFTLKVIGDGPLSSRVRNACAGLNVELLGSRSLEETLILMRLASFTVVPSECYETFSRVVMESYACGTPVVASRIGALTDIVQDRKTGLLFEAGNAEDLSAKIGEMIRNTGLRVQMGRSARHVYESTYTQKQNYQQLLTIYEKAINGQAAHDQIV